MFRGLISSFSKCHYNAKKSLCLPRTDLYRAKKSLRNRSQFRTLFLPHRFIKIRPSHQRPVSIEFLTIWRIPEFPKSEQNRKSCRNVRIWRKRAADRRKNHSNFNKSFGMKMLKEGNFGSWKRIEFQQGAALPNYSEDSRDLVIKFQFTNYSPWQRPRAIGVGGVGWWRWWDVGN